MSTRSGKRIHNSFHENILQPEDEHVTDVERKTRSRRLKENVEDLSVSVTKNKKRVNYVSYPSTDDDGTDTVDGKENEGRSTRVLRKNALIESNLITSSTESAELPTETKKLTRTTRRTCRITECTPDEVQEDQNHAEEVNIQEAQKIKKGKKKKQVLAEQVTEVETISKKNLKKNKKGKKGKGSRSMIVEDIEPENGKTNNLNKSNMSNDSFHSAAGSPLNVLDDNDIEMVKSPEKMSEVLNTIEKTDDDEKQKPERRRTRSVSRLSNFVTTPSFPERAIKESRKRKSIVTDLNESVKHATVDKETELEEPKNKITMKAHKKQKQSVKETISADNIVNATFEKETEPIEPPINTFDNVSKKRKSTIKATVYVTDNAVDIVEKDTKDSTFDLEDNLETRKSIRNTTIDLNDVDKRASIKNTTFDKIETPVKVNTTFDKELSIIETIKSTVKDKNTTLDKHEHPVDKNATYDKDTSSEILSSARKRWTRQSVDRTFENATNSSQIDSVAETAGKTTVLNTTFEKDSETETNLETPYETLNGTIDLRRSIISISSQKSTEVNTIYEKPEISNSTFDTDKKLDKNSKSSLISSDNSNVTLDKSDVSRISITSDDSKENILNATPFLIESSIDESQINISKHTPKSLVQAPITPLKRDGTFTKDGPDVELATPRTPTKHMSLASPGCTPFHTIKSSSKERSQMLNITRSLEKSHSSSLVEPLPRATMVKFCSPVNNPAVVLQQRRKVIKSNLKGSNKSFVFDETPSEVRPAPRKRSYTQSDADDARAKRKRIASDLQHSVSRLSRPRTSSASGKLAEPTTPSKKPATPSKKSETRVSRTKLPNFAALHQKQFDRMESLDECQERRARRARQLLTPTGAVTVLERSPRENVTEPQKSLTTSDLPKNEKAPKPKKPETPVKSLPTLKSLNPGYTRFGFKLNLDVNPFSIPSKSDANSSKVFSFSSNKASKAKTSLSSSKKTTNMKPLKEIKANLTRQTLQPSLAGTSVRREVAKLTVMREKSFTDRRNVNRNENRTVIKGVRTNRRFELQMRMRNMD